MGRIFKGIFLILMLSTIINAAGSQLQLNNGVWQSIGFQGAYKSGLVEGVGYDADRSFEFYDVADDNITWVTTSSTNPNNLIYNGASGQVTNYGPTTQIKSTIGLFAIKGQRSKKTVKFTVFDGTVANVVKLKVANPRAYRSDIPMYRMYVEGQDGVSAFRIDFQADYQGMPFKVKFGSESESYVGYFNYENTYDNPAPLKLDILTSNGQGSEVLITNAIDFNITDNNLSLLFGTSDFRIKTTTGAFSTYFTPHSADTGNRIEAYSMIDNNIYNRFDTRNTLTQSNTLTKFKAGRGYWVKTTSQLATNDGNYTKIGLITSSKSDINDDFYSKLGNGWHMLSFSESDLRYAPSGMFIPRGAAPFTLYFGRHVGNNTNVNQTRGDFINMADLLAGPSLALTTPVMSKAINYASVASNLLYGEGQKIRAYPATNSGGIEGLIILSDGLIEINSSSNSITTLAGEPLSQTPRGMYSSRYGEFAIGATLNNLSLSNINATISISMPKYSSDETIIADLSTSLINSLLAIETGLLDASKKKGSTVASTSAKAYGIDFDANQTTYAPNLVSFPNVLLAAGARFSIRDKTSVNLYEFKKNGKFKLTGPLGSSTVDVTIKDTNMTRTINAINNVSTQTGVIALDNNVSGANIVMLTASSGAISIEEDYNATLFEDLPLGTSKLNAAQLKATQGAFIEVYSTRDLLDRKVSYDISFMDGAGDNNTSWSNLYTINFDTNTSGQMDTTVKAPNLSQDLRTNAIWVMDFPIKSSLISKFASFNKEITNITIQRFTHDNVGYYDFLDLTKSPDTWYGNTYDTDDKEKYNNDYQGIFHIYPNQNYWVKIKDKTPLPSTTKAMSKDSSISFVAKASFNNTMSKGVATVQNHISGKLNVKFNRLFLNPIKNDYYNVVAILGGSRYYLRDNGQYFTLSIDDRSMGLSAKKPNEANDRIFINAYDGNGNVLKEEASSTSRFSINFQKPPTPEVMWDKDGKMKVSNKNNYTVEVYSNFISDIKERRKTVMVEDFNDTKIGWKASKDEATYGSLIPIRVVLKDPKTDLYSDIKGIIYAPITTGQVLKVTKDMKIAQVPYSYMQKQMLTSQDAGSRSIEPYNGKNGVDNGVQIQMLDGAKDKDIYVQYYPEGSESQRRINQFGGARTMYLSAKSDKTTDSKAILAITYLPAYEGKMFYVTFNGSLYQGRFSSSDAYNNDGSSYDLSQSTIEVDDAMNNASFAQTTATDTHGYKITQAGSNSQMIVIPKSKKTTGTGGAQLPLPAI